MYIILEYIYDFQFILGSVHHTKQGHKQKSIIVNR